MWRRVATTLASLTILLMLACGGSTGKIAMTLEGYADWCGRINAEEEQRPDPDTWGEVEAFAEEQAKAYNSVAPPDELMELHKANLGALRLILGKAKDHNDDDYFTVVEDIDQYLNVVMIIRGAEQDLTDEMRNQLLATGCINPSSNRG